MKKKLEKSFCLITIKLCRKFRRFLTAAAADNSDEKTTIFLRTYTFLTSQIFMKVASRENLIKLKKCKF
jgi:hypothetical protein